MKKILFIQNEYGVSGSPVAAFNLALFLRDKGYKIHVACPNPGIMQKMYLDEKIESAVVPEIGSNLDIAYAYAKNFDLCIVFCLPLFGAALAAVNAKIPTIFSVHEAVMGGTEIVRDNLFAQRALGLASALVFNSDYCKNMYNHRHQNKNTHVIPIGTRAVSLEGQKPVNAKKIFVQIGSIEARKGQDLSINAFKELENKAELHIIGRVLDPRFHQVIQTNLPSNVKFLGELDTLKTLSLLAGSDGLVMSSRDETLPNVILEAMNLNIPVVSSDVGAIREVISHNKTGLLYENEDTQGLLDNLKRVIIDKALVSKLTENAKIVIQNTRTIEHYGSKYLSLIEELLQTKE